MVMSFLPALLGAQTVSKSDSLSLFYNIKEVESPRNTRRLDSLLTSVGGSSISIRIKGYADFLSNDRYNIILSQKRADAVKNYLLAKAASKINILSCQGFGEKYSKENNSMEGDVLFRRVDILVVRQIAVENNTVIPLEEEAVKEEPVDTKNDFEELTKGQTLAVEGLNFEPGRHIVTKSSAQVLQQLLATLKKNKSMKIEIQGHVCCTDGDQDGLDYDTNERKLSENRAKAIYNYLISKGISAKRLSYKGFGHTKPKFAPERNPEEEQANRRVEIFVLDK